jgi:hypothetical protein
MTVCRTCVIRTTQGAPGSQETTFCRDTKVMTIAIAANPLSRGRGSMGLVTRWGLFLVRGGFQFLILCV